MLCNFTQHSTEQQTDIDLVIEAFWQIYSTNPDILKVGLEAAEQQPKQDTAAFLCDVQTLDRRAYREYPDMTDQMVLTSFIEAQTGKRLRWELRKEKPTLADDALTIATELFPGNREGKSVTGGKPEQNSPRGIGILFSRSHRWVCQDVPSRSQ